MSTSRVTACSTARMNEDMMRALLSQLEASISAKIDSSLAPLAERVENIEKNVAEVNESVSNVVKNVEDVTKTVNNMEGDLRDVIKEVGLLKSKQTSSNLFSAVTANGAHAGQECGTVISNTVRKQPISTDLSKVLERSARTISLYPVDRMVLDEARDKLVKDGFVGDTHMEAMRMAAFEFLSEEMKLRQDEWDRLAIIDIFTPSRKDAATLYLEFNTLREADSIKALAVHLRSGERLRVARHIPWQARERVNHLEMLAKSLREAGNRTRLDLRGSDFVLQFRPKDDPNAAWTSHVNGEDIPPFDMKPSPLNSERSPGEAKGRRVRPGIRAGGPETRKRKAASPLSGTNKVPLGPKKHCAATTDEEEEDTTPPGEDDLDTDELFVSGDEALARIREAQSSLKRMSTSLDTRTTYDRSCK